MTPDSRFGVDCKKAVDGEKFADLLAHIKYAIPTIFGHAILD